MSCTSLAQGGRLASPPVRKTPLPERLRHRVSTPNGAAFSRCRRYRYLLWRNWGNGDRRVAFVGLNPSTADEVKNDPTVTRCINFARNWGYDGILMLNAYGLRSTDPRGLLEVEDPVGPGTDDAIRKACEIVERVVVCWGNHCTPQREARLVRLIGHRTLLSFGCNQRGTPRHPLYLPRTAPLSPWQFVNR